MSEKKEEGDLPKQLFDLHVSAPGSTQWALDASPDGRFVCFGATNRCCTLVERSKISELARDPSSASSKFNREKDTVVVQEAGQSFSAPQRIAFSCSGHLLAVPSNDSQKAFDIYDMTSKKFPRVFRLVPGSNNVTVFFCFTWRPKKNETEDKTNICFAGGVISGASIFMYRFDDPKKSNSSSSSQQEKGKEEETSFESLVPLRVLSAVTTSHSTSPAMTITTGFFGSRNNNNSSSATSSASSPSSSTSSSSQSYRELVFSTASLKLQCLSIDESQDFSDESTENLWEISTASLWIFTILQLNSFEILHGAAEDKLQITEAMTGNKLRQIDCGSKQGIAYSGCIFPSRRSPQAYFERKNPLDVTQLRGSVAIFVSSQKKLGVFRPFDDSFKEAELDDHRRAVALDPQGMFFYTSDRNGNLQVFESPVKKMKDARLLPVFLLREKSKGKMSEAFSIFYVLQLVSVFLPFC